MCGIAGFVNLKNPPFIKKNHLKKMIDTIKHRGPDGQGYFLDKNVGLGHCRLAIIDLTFGHQPMNSANGQYWITYNGEIYNYLELNKQLKAKGYKFKTASDTEVLLYMYQEYGPKCLSFLNGMFAFAIWDKKKKQLFAARDRFGIKPFYYFYQNKKLVFASEIKAILKIMPQLAQLNPIGLNEYLTFQFCLQETTLFKQIKKLPPACFLTFANNNFKIKKYWQLSFQINHEKKEEYFCNQTLKLIKKAVKIRLRSDVAIGTYLSGGLDSSLITALASKDCPYQLKTFTGYFNQPGFSELDWAKKMAKSCQTKNFQVKISSNDFIKSIEKLIYFMDEPAAGPGLFPQYYVSKLASKHVKVILGGQGGDEIFGGYVRYLLLYLEKFLKKSFSGSSNQLSSLLPGLSALKSYLPLVNYFWQKDLFASNKKRYFRLINRSQDFKSLIKNDIFADYKTNLKQKFNQAFLMPKKTSLLNQMTHFDISNSLPALLQVEDRVSMAASIETRVPFLDHHLVEFTASIPTSIKFKNGQLKYLLKQLAKQILPEKIAGRKDKMGFPVPLTSWYKNDLETFVKDILLGKTTKKRGIFKTKKISSLLKQPAHFDRQIWAMVCLELWFRNFIDKN